MTRWRWPLLLAALLAGASFLVWVSWGRKEAAPRPPGLDLSGLDEDLALVVREARARVEKDPSSAAAWGTLGKILMAHGLWAESAVCLRQAERLDPADPAWPYLLADHLTREEPEEGIAALRRAILAAGEESDLSLFRLRLAEVLAGLGRADEAETELAPLAGMKGPRIDYVRGVVAMQRGRWAEARALFEGVLAEPRLARDASRQLAAACRHLGDAVAAARHDARARSLSPTPPPWGDPYLKDLRDYRVDKLSRLERARAGTADDALSTLRALTRPDGQEAFILRLRAAEMLTAEGRLSEAETVLREGLLHFPDSSRLLLRLAELRERAGSKEALAEALSLARKAGEGMVARLAAGRALMGLGREAEAADEFRAAAAAGPGEPAPHYRLGIALARQGKREEARQAFERAILVAGAESEPARELASWRAKWGEK